MSLDGFAIVVWILLVVWDQLFSDYPGPELEIQNIEAQPTLTCDPCVKYLRTSQADFTLLSTSARAQRFQLRSKSYFLYTYFHSIHNDDFNITLEPLRLTPKGG